MEWGAKNAMKITTAQQYRSALAAMRHLSQMEKDPAIEKCHRLLEAATADYSERLKGHGLSKGRPRQYHQRPRTRPPRR
jgi:hypothetical protein